MARYRKTEDGWVKTGGGVSEAELDVIRDDVSGVRQDLTQIESNLKAEDNLQFRFATDGEGNYGYLKGDDTFVPFKSGFNPTPIQVVNNDIVSGQVYEIPNSASATMVIIKGGNHDASRYNVTASSITNCSMLEFNSLQTGANMWVQNLCVVIPDKTDNIRVNFSVNGSGAGRISYAIY